MDIRFDSKKASNIKDTAVTATADSREPKLAYTNLKNKIKNKRRKNNRKGHNNNTITSQNQSQPRSQSQENKSCLLLSETRLHPWRAIKAEKRDRIQVCKPCSACGGTSHSFTRCYLVQGQDKDWISNKNREAFRSNMKVATFKRRVDDFRASQKTFENWRCEDRSIVKEKIIGRALALLCWDVDSHTSDNNYSLLNSAASVYVFHKINKVTNFKRATKG